MAAALATSTGAAFCARVDVGQVDARRGDGDALAAAKLHAADFQLQGLGLYEPMEVNQLAARRCVALPAAA